jgi:hypothetical protein
LFPTAGVLPYFDTQQFDLYSISEKLFLISLQFREFDHGIVSGRAASSSVPVEIPPVSAVVEVVSPLPSC